MSSVSNRCSHIDANGIQCSLKRFEGPNAICCGRTHHNAWTTLSANEKASRETLVAQKALQTSSAAPAATSTPPASSGISVIQFYNKNFGYGFLGNFHESPITTADGKKYPCAEAYFQSRKYPPNLWDHFTTDKMRASPHYKSDLGTDAFGEVAFQLANRELDKNLIDPNWKTRNVQVMREALKLKFDQNPRLKEELIKTGTYHLVERTDRDSFWGDGRDGKGQNMLGKLLMELRATYQNEASSPPSRPAYAPLETKTVLTQPQQPNEQSSILPTLGCVALAGIIGTLAIKALQLLFKK